MVSELNEIHMASEMATAGIDLLASASQKNAIRQLVAAPRNDVSIAAMTMLAQLQDMQATEVIVARLVEDDPTIVREGLQVLARLGVATEPIIFQLLESSHPGVIKEAVYACGAFGVNDAIAKLREIRSRFGTDSAGKDSSELCTAIDLSLFALEDIDVLDVELRQHDTKVTIRLGDLQCIAYTTQQPRWYRPAIFEDIPSSLAERLHVLDLRAAVWLEDGTRNAFHTLTFLMQELETLGERSVGTISFQDLMSRFVCRCSQIQMPQGASENEPLRIHDLSENSTISDLTDAICEAVDALTAAVHREIELKAAEVGILPGRMRFGRYKAILETGVTVDPISESWTRMSTIFDMWGLAISQMIESDEMVPILSTEENVAAGLLHILLQANSFSWFSQFEGLVMDVDCDPGTLTSFQTIAKLAKAQVFIFDFGVHLLEALFIAVSPVAFDMASLPRDLRVQIMKYPSDSNWPEEIRSVEESVYRCIERWREHVKRYSFPPESTWLSEARQPPIPARKRNPFRDFYQTPEWM